MSRFEALLREARKRTRLTQKELAKKVAISESYLGKLETGVLPPPARDVVLKLAAALGMSEESKLDLLLAANAVGTEDLKGLNLQALSSLPPSTAQVPHPPATPAAAGSVLQQILEHVQALTATVSQLQADLADLKQRTAIPTLAPRDLPAVAAPADPFIGHWQGRNRQWLPKGTNVTLMIPSQRAVGEGIEVPHDITLTIGWSLTLESAGDAQLSGGGEVSVDLRPLGEKVKEFVYRLTVLRGAVEDNRITLLLKGEPRLRRPRWEDRVGVRLVRMVGTLIDYGWRLVGEYEAEELLTERVVVGKFSLEKASDEESGVPAIMEEGVTARRARKRGKSA